jgi:hypothetical protein
MKLFQIYYHTKNDSIIGSFYTLVADDEINNAKDAETYLFMWDAGFTPNLEFLSYKEWPVCTTKQVLKELKENE